MNTNRITAAEALEQIENEKRGDISHIYDLIRSSIKNRETTIYLYEDNIVPSDVKLLQSDGYKVTNLSSQKDGVMWRIDFDRVYKTPEAQYIENMDAHCDRQDDLED